MTAQTVLDFTAARAKRRPRVTYWPTTPLSQTQLVGAIRQAEQQDEAVMAIFRTERRPLAPSEVWRIGQRLGRQWLLTSVRRSITNLANLEGGPLERTDLMKDGPYGRPEHCWALWQPRDTAA